ncbi:MAG: CvpA family protein [Pseudomonadota bacterium]
MSLLDALIIVLLVIFLTRGIWTGLVRQIASIAALIIGFVIAGRYYGESASFVTPFISNQQAGFFVAYLLLFAASFGAVILLGFFLKQVITLSLLGWFDKFLGGVLGLAKAYLLSCLLIMGLALFISGANPFFSKSYFYPYLEKSSRILLALIKDQELRNNLLPRQPAISTFLETPVKVGKQMWGDSK